MSGHAQSEFLEETEERGTMPVWGWQWTAVENDEMLGESFRKIKFMDIFFKDNRERDIDKMRKRKAEIVHVLLLPNRF